MNTEYNKWCEVDTDALKWNIKQVRNLVGSDVKIAAVVKANAYGHGSLEIMEYLIEAGAEFIVVSSVNEAIEMRKKYKKVQTLVLGVTQDENAEEAIRWGVTQTVASEAQAKKLSEIAGEIGMGVSCHIKLDTGMNRIGFKVSEEAADTIVRISKLPGIHVNGMFSHFATADEEDKTFSNLQFARFREMDEMLKKRGLRIPIRHMANSAAIMEMPETYMDMVRSGIITYGIYPSDEVDRSKINLRPAMSLRSRISFIKTLKGEEGVSYGLTEKAGPGTVIATIPVGYADGYLRAFSSRGEVIVKGRRAKIIGRVCMDQMMIDVTDIEGVSVGDTVTLFGRDGSEYISIEELAEKAGTISYELLCAVGRRVPRAFIKDGNLVKITNYLD